MVADSSEQRREDVESKESSTALTLNRMLLGAIHSWFLSLNCDQSLDLFARLRLFVPLPCHVLVVGDTREARGFQYAQEPRVHAYCAQIQAKTT
jgi:hypothetical protein